jgi:hypothetical protein
MEQYELNLDKNISLTADDAIRNTQNQLNIAMSDFDRWVSTNPLLANSNNVEYRIQQQNIKVLKLKMKEIMEMKEEFQNTLMILSSNPEAYVDPNVPNTFTRSKADNVPIGVTTTKVAEKRGNRVSTRVVDIQRSSY